MKKFAVILLVCVITAIFAGACNKNRARHMLKLRRSRQGTSVENRSSLVSGPVS